MQIVGNSQMSEDADLPALSTFTAIALKPTVHHDTKNENALSGDMKKDVKRSSELSKRGRKKISKDDEDNELDCSQELPIVCKDPEG
jgi:hypothetical protein